MPRFFGLSRDKAEALVAELRPRPNPPRREVVTACPAAKVGPALASAATASQQARVANDARPAVPERTSPVRSEGVQPFALSAPEPPARERDVVEPLTSDLRRLHVTVSKAFLAKLAAARDAVSHAIPDGDTEAVLSAALDLLLEKAAKRRGLVEKPRSAPPRPSSDRRHIPAAAAREVWQRDGGRCSFRLPDGSVCGSTLRLQLDHILPVALGGTSEAANLRVACARHNQLAARRAFGDAWMHRFTRTPVAAPGEEDSSSAEDVCDQT